MFLFLRNLTKFIIFSDEGDWRRAEGGGGEHEVPGGGRGEGAGQVSHVTKHMASHMTENKVPG